MSNKINRSLFLLIYIFCISIKGQDFQSSRLNLGELEIRFALTASDSLYLLGENSTWKYSPKGWTKMDLQGEISPLVSHFNYFPIQVDSTYYMIERGLGQVYRLDAYSLKRIDNSFSMKNNYGSAIFQQAGKLYSYGGYGFWNYHPYFVRYSWQKKEWDLIVHEKNTLPPGRAKPFIQHDGEYLYLLGGEGENGYLDDVVKVNLNSVETETLGKIDSSFPFKTSSSNYFELNDNNYYLFQDLNWVKINAKNNQFQLANITKRFKEHQIATNPVIYNDSLYLFTLKNKILLKNVISLDDFEKLFDSPQQLYKVNNKKYLLWIILGLIGLLPIFVLYKIGIWQKRKKTVAMLQQNYLTLGRKILILNETEKEVLQALIAVKKIKLSALCDLPIFSEYSPNYQKKAIGEVLKKLKTRLETDKRMSKKISLTQTDSKTKTFELHGEIYHYRGWYNHLWS